MKTTTNLTHPAFVLLAFALGWLVPSLTAQATCQKGCLTNANTVLGEDALVNDSRGLSNTAIGSGALHDDTGGFILGGFNAATGAGALTSNTTSVGNTATGASALEFNTTGSGNIAIGQTALHSNTTGRTNIANLRRELFTTIGNLAKPVGQFVTMSRSVSARGGFLFSPDGPLNPPTSLEISPAGIAKR